MTEPTETVHGGEQSDSEAESIDDASQGSAELRNLETGADDPEPSPNSEAARWRTKLREVEAERDALTERLTGYQRRECEAAVADLLDEPGDLWEIGQANVTEFYGDHGALDEGVLRAAAGALCEMRPKLAKPRGPQWQNFGQGTAPPPQSVGWSSVLKGYNQW